MDCYSLQWTLASSCLPNCFNAAVARIKDNGPLLGSNGGASLGIMRVVGLAKSSRPEQQEHMEENVERCKKVKVRLQKEIFPHCENSDRAVTNQQTTFLKFWKRLDYNSSETA